MDDIRQERPNKGLILQLSKKFDTHVKKSMAFQALKK